jgi:hypothetical protein
VLGLIADISAFAETSATPSLLPVFNNIFVVREFWGDARLACSLFYTNMNLRSARYERRTWNGNEFHNVAGRRDEPGTRPSWFNVFAPRWRDRCQGLAH